MAGGREGERGRGGKLPSSVKLCVIVRQDSSSQVLARLCIALRLMLVVHPPPPASFYPDSPCIALALACTFPRTLLEQAYLMFGDRRYLDMFMELYAATMRHMKVRGGGGGV